MNNQLYTAESGMRTGRATPENPVVVVRAEFEVVLREAVNAKERLGCAEHLMSMTRHVAPEVQAEYEAAKHSAFVADQRMKNVAGRIISFGLLTCEEIEEISAHYGY